MPSFHSRILFALMAIAVLSACERHTELETRTFDLQSLAPGEAEALVSPYVYMDREGRPGTVVAIEGALTVRETEDNLEKIARVLAEYDRDRPDVRLHFRLVEATAEPQDDPRIADLREALEGVLDFGGYRLAAEAVVSATDRSRVGQNFAGGEELQVGATVSWVRPGLLRLHDVTLLSHGTPRLNTTVNVRPGQTLVLGSASEYGGDSTLLLTVTADTVGGL